jgi:N-methylhydantoinase B
VLAYRLREDSAGAGRWRGGEGNHLELTPVGHDAVFSLNGDRASTRPFGLFGGKPGATARCHIRRRDGTQQEVAPRTMKAERLAVREGDVLVVEATSGAGYGNPLERDAQGVLDDVLDGLLSRERARTQYGVVVDPETGALDEEATRELRVELGRAYDAIAPRLGAVDRDGYELVPPTAG